MKKTILSLLRRLNGTERNLQKISQLEQQIIKLKESTEIFCNSLEKRNNNISERLTEIHRQFIESNEEKAEALDNISSTIDNSTQKILAFSESIVNILKHQEGLVEKNYRELTTLIEFLQNNQPIEKISSKIDSLIALDEKNRAHLESIDQLHTAVKYIQELCIQSIYNTISINSISENQKKILYVPGGTQKQFLFSVIDGKLALGDLKKNKYKKTEAIFIISNMKSGTYLLGKILAELGFCDLDIHAGEKVFTEHRNRSIEDQLNFPTEHLVGLPFELQVQCVAKGQFLLGHIDSQYSDILKDKKIFCCIRDLRYVCVSALRFNQRRSFYSDCAWYNKKCTEDALYTFLSDTHMASQVVTLSKNIAVWVKLFPESEIRYEGLQNEGSSEYDATVEKIASITGTEVKDVIDARNKALGQKTHSYSGKPSKLEGIWSQRVEKKFQELGLHEVNATLGYPRDWTPENYCLPT